MNDVFDRHFALAAFDVSGEPFRVTQDHCVHKKCRSGDAAKKPNQTGLGGDNQPDSALSVSIGHFRIPLFGST
jgi:hypothetical protein